ncbi:hypothetical protein B0T25DRAFT_568018 [Lasiosphaeria hispida]|uniref:Uncharacterized protein n=1 Tax=Lasiosphaeria hispida TaxID=260671 RepID=A0AAJ0MDS0_9PEZI|nr:hypothetical protein B0T25DRAFT_568018 [Lasiosphaeria hispida]
MAAPQRNIAVTCRFNEMLGDRVATIYVGKDRIKWVVHENLLHSISLDGYNSCYMSELFATYLYARDYKGIIDLPDLEPSEFEAYVRRLYRNVFISDGVTPKQAFGLDDEGGEGGSPSREKGKGKSVSSPQPQDRNKTVGEINQLDRIRTRPMLLRYITSQDQLHAPVTSFAVPFDPSGENQTDVTMLGASRHP